MKLGSFTVVFVQQRQRGIEKKKDVMHVQSCCFANVNLFAFLSAVVLLVVAVIVA